MKYSALIFKNLFRNKMRSFLTVMLMASIFFFVATLLSILANFDQASSMGDGENRLAVQSAISLANMLPYSQEAKIRQIPGVVDVAKLQWIGAYYKSEKNFFANFAVDHNKMETVFNEYSIPKDQMEAFKNDRRGAIVGPELMKRFGWKIGDRIVLTGTIFPFNPEVTIRGVYKHPVNTSAFYFHMDYFEQAMGDFGQVGTFWIKVAKGKSLAGISEQVDAMFKNTEYPTETFTEKEFQQNFLSMIGNIKLLFTAVSACAIFMVILLAAITMSMSARERVTEIAVLKAIGFERGLVLTLMLIEFVLLALTGGLLGTLGARGIYQVVNMAAVTQGFLVNFGVNNGTMATCIAISLAVGLIAGGFPAWRSANLRVVDGLRKVV